MIDARGEVNGIVVAGPATAGTVIDGLTVEHALKAGILVMRTRHVTLRDNVVTANDQSCAGYRGCVNPKAAADPEAGGVYGNTVVRNAAIANGAAGILMAGPMPGAASHDNLVDGNIVRDNGMPGIVVHSHTPGQNMNGNVITDNFVSGNGATIGDPDAKLTPGQTTGIVVFSAVAPLTGTRVQGNVIADQRYGVWLSGTVREPVVSGNVAGDADVGTLVKAAVRAPR